MKPDASKATGRPLQALINSLSSWGDGGPGATTAVDIAEAVAELIRAEMESRWTKPVDRLEAERDRLRGHTLRLAEKADQQMRMLADAKQREDRLRAALADLVEQIDGIGIQDWSGAEGLCLEAARAALEGGR